MRTRASRRPEKGLAEPTLNPCCCRQRASRHRQMWEIRSDRTSARSTRALHKSMRRRCLSLHKPRARATAPHSRVLRARQGRRPRPARIPEIKHRDSDTVQQAESRLLAQGAANVSAVVLSYCGNHTTTEFLPIRKGTAARIQERAQAAEAMHERPLGPAGAVVIELHAFRSTCDGHGLGDEGFMVNRQRLRSL